MRQHALTTLIALVILTTLAACGDKEETASQAEAPVAPAATPAPAAPTEAVPTLPAPSGVDPGKLKYAGVCLGCHGPEGKGQGPFPKLAGRPAMELEAMLKDYRAGKTRGPQSATMMPFAKPLSDEEIQAIAAYLAPL